jgi:UDP-2-acetamido-2-deoxy-ribo-hexuluronate aminotransferase
MSKPVIPFIDLKAQYAQLKPAIQERMNRVLDHGQYIMGPEVRELEQRLEARTGARHCITVASGTEALLISLMALGIGRGDEVITTSFTFIATAEVIVLLGAVPVLVDIDPVTCNIDPDGLEAAITERTRAIMPVSLYGQTADMDVINAIAARHAGITVIEDAAQSFGATYQGRQSCNLSTFACTSFFPSKPLGCYGDGGAIFTSDDAMAQACREIRVHGQSKRYVHTRLGVGGRMDTLQCAVVLAKLDRFEWEVARRMELGERYNRMLDELGVERVQQRQGYTSVFAQYTVYVPQRDKVQAALLADGVPTAVHYPVPINRQPFYQAYCPADSTPLADAMAARVMSLPMSPDLSEAQQDHVVAALARALAALV